MRRIRGALGGGFRRTERAHGAGWDALARGHKGGGARDASRRVARPRRAGGEVQGALVRIDAKSCDPAEEGLAQRQLAARQRLAAREAEVMGRRRLMEGRWRAAVILQAAARRCAAARQVGFRRRQRAAAERLARREADVREAARARAAARLEFEARPNEEAAQAAAVRGNGGVERRACDDTPEWLLEAERMLWLSPQVAAAMGPTTATSRKRGMASSAAPSTHGSVVGGAPCASSGGVFHVGVAPPQQPRPQRLGARVGHKAHGGRVATSEGRMLWLSPQVAAAMGPTTATSRERGMASSAAPSTHGSVVGGAPCASSGGVFHVGVAPPQQPRPQRLGARVGHKAHGGRVATSEGRMPRPGREAVAATVEAARGGGGSEGEEEWASAEEWEEGSGDFDAVDGGPEAKEAATKAAEGVEVAAGRAAEKATREAAAVTAEFAYTFAANPFSQARVEQRLRLWPTEAARADEEAVRWEELGWSSGSAAAVPTAGSAAGPPAAGSAKAVTAVATGTEAGRRHGKGKATMGREEEAALSRPTSAVELPLAAAAAAEAGEAAAMATAVAVTEAAAERERGGSWGSGSDAGVESVLTRSLAQARREDGVRLKAVLEESKLVARAESRSMAEALVAVAPQETTPERRMNAGAGRLEAMVEWRKGGASKASPQDSGGKETRGERRRRQTARRLDFARPSDAPPSD